MFFILVMVSVPMRSMAWKAGLLLLCWGLTSGEVDVTTPEPETTTTTAAPIRTLDFGYVPAGVYETVAHYEPGPIGILFQMVHAFLHLVQPNPFPEGKLTSLSLSVVVMLRSTHAHTLTYSLAEASLSGAELFSFSALCLPEATL